VWWYTPVTAVLWRLRQKDFEFQASLGYIAKEKKKKKQPTKSWAKLAPYIEHNLIFLNDKSCQLNFNFFFFSKSIFLPLFIAPLFFVPPFLFLPFPSYFPLPPSLPPPLPSCFALFF
jgi:hypothetical protein